MFLLSERLFIQLQCSVSQISATKGAVRQKQLNAPLRFLRYTCAYKAVLAHHATEQTRGNTHVGERKISHTGMEFTRMIFNQKSRQICFSFFLWLVGATALSAQATGGNIAGTVTDPTHSTIVGAQITITNLGKGESQVVTTNKAGAYSIPNLQPGQYSISVTAPGFSAVEDKDVVVQVGSQLVGDYTLAVGNVSERVEVRADRVAVELGSATLSNVVNGKTVRELPLNGRDWTQLAVLEPGVHTIDAQQTSGTSLRATRGFGTQITIGGNRASQNVYRLDGVIVNDYSGGGPSNTAGLALGVDAVQEFSVVTGAPSADYGRTSGGVINAITRSGQNAFHGSLFEFIRNSALDARNYFDPVGAPPPSFKRNQFGGTIGGPISIPGLYNGKDRSFFFFNYEGFRQRLATTTTFVVPSTAARSGNLVAGKVTVKPEIVPYLALYPLPDPGTESGDTGKSTFQGKQSINDNFYTGRIDQKLGEHDQIHATYLQTPSDLTSPDSINFTIQAQQTRRNTASVEETHTFGSNLVSVARLGYNRSIVFSQIPAGVIDPRAADTSLGFVPGGTVGNLQVGSGVTTITGGLGSIAETDYLYNSYQANEDMTLQRGRHTIRFGGAAEHTQLTISTQNTPGGTFVFSSLKNFETNAPTSFAASFQGASPRLYLRQYIAGGYIQDDYRLRRNLTLNLGGRYEFSTVPTEKYNHLSNLINFTDSAPHLGSPFYGNSTFKDFSPRLGFAWDPFSQGKTSVRGGAGIYDALPLTYELLLVVVNASPYFQTGSLNPIPVGSFPKAAYPLLTAGTLRNTSIQNEPSRSYIEQWNLSVQQELPGHTILLIGYAGQHGVHQPFRANDVNIVPPTLTPQGLLWPSVASRTNLVNSNTGPINYLDWRGSNTYHGLNVNVQRDVAGLRLGAAYTWSKSMDIGSTAVGGDFYNSITTLFPFDTAVFHSLSDFDVRNNFVFNFLYQLKAKNENSALGRLSGWQLGGIYKAANGIPFSPIISGDPLGLLNSSALDFPDRASLPGCERPVNPHNAAHYIRTECFAQPAVPNRMGNSGRNGVIGPGVSVLDASAVKDTRFGERFHAEFRAEVFNILNHASFAVPDRTSATLYGSSGNGAAAKFTPVSTAGTLKLTATTSRQIQFGIKLLF